MKTPPDPEFRNRIQQDFDRQAFMATIGARLDRIEPGQVWLSAPQAESLTQQDGFLHAGVVTTLMDVACGYAALSLMPKNARVLSVEIKSNFLSPAVGVRFVAVGEVLKSGRTLTVCRGELLAELEGGSRKRVAAMQATMIAQPGESR